MEIKVQIFEKKVKMYIFKQILWFFNFIEKIYENSNKSNKYLITQIADYETRIELVEETIVELESYMRG